MCLVGTRLRDETCDEPVNAGALGCRRRCYLEGLPELGTHGGVEIEIRNHHVW